MYNVILFRKDLLDLNEYEECCSNIHTVDQRLKIPYRSNVLCRYSCLPFYSELEKDMSLLGSKMIVSYLEHQMISDIENWYEYFEDLTPKTWFYHHDIPNNTNHEFIVKGSINSRKNLWNTHCFAKNRDECSEMASRLMQDSLISQQKICYRKFEKFVTFDKSLSGSPIVEEYRFFIFNCKIIGSSFYWSNFPQYERSTDVGSVPKEMIDEISRRVREMNGPICFCVDIAKTVDTKTKFGNWMIVEFNDFQMAGLSMIESKSFYSNLKEALNAK